MIHLVISLFIIRSYDISFSLLLHGETLADSPNVELDLGEDQTVRMKGIWGEIWHDFIEVHGKELVIKRRGKLTVQGWEHALPAV